MSSLYLSPLQRAERGRGWTVSSEVRAHWTFTIGLFIEWNLKNERRGWEESYTHLSFIAKFSSWSSPLVCSFSSMSHVRSIAFLSFMHSSFLHLHHRHSKWEEVFISRSITISLNASDNDHKKQRTNDRSIHLFFCFLLCAASFYSWISIVTDTLIW